MHTKKVPLTEDNASESVENDRVAEGYVQYSLYHTMTAQPGSKHSQPEGDKAKWEYIRRIQGEMSISREPIYTIDLFSGCGGLTLGFKHAGFVSALASDIDENCKHTFNANFPETPFVCGDITQLTEQQFREQTGGRRIDVIVGGPPCQGFSLANKRRNKTEDDPRNRLFYQYLKVIEWYQPKVFVMENVKGLLSMHGGSVIKEILRCFAEAGYRVDYRVLKASNYGVPQSRERVIIVGVRNDLNKAPVFPEDIIPQPVSVDKAIMDLPQIDAGQGMDGMPYLAPPANDYQRMMRLRADRLRNHISMKHTARLVARFHAIRPGQSLIDVWDEHGPLRRGKPSEKSTIKFSQNNQRVYADQPAPTIAASFQSNFVHPHLDRNFTAREGARLQSFPDDFVFEGFRTKMSWEKGLSQYQQIGNAVPPLLAYAIAKTIRKNYFDE